MVRRGHPSVLWHVDARVRVGGGKENRTLADAVANTRAPLPGSGALAHYTLSWFLRKASRQAVPHPQDPEFASRDISARRSPRRLRRQRSGPGPGPYASLPPHRPVPAGSAVSGTAGKLMPSSRSSAAIRTGSIRPTPNCPPGSVLATRRTWKRSTSVLWAPMASCSLLWRTPGSPVLAAAPVRRRGRVLPATCGSGRGNGQVLRRPEPGTAGAVVPADVLGDSAAGPGAGEPGTAGRAGDTGCPSQRARLRPTVCIRVP
jgi:hypothetical protein